MNYDWLTITNHTGTTVLETGTGGAAWTATYTGVVRFYIHLESCGTQNACRTKSVQSELCLATSQYPDATVAVNCNEITQTITNCDYAGDYAVLNLPTDGITYTFTSSNPNDFLIVTTSGNSFLSSSSYGTTPLTVTIPTAGIYRLHVMANSYCGTESACRTTTVTCCAPSSAATAVSGPGNLCSGESGSYTVNGGSLGSVADWKWYANSCGSGPVVATGATVILSPTVTTTYYARAEGSCDTTTCVSKTVTVKSVSTAPTSISGTGNICPSGSTTLSVVGGSLGTGANWQWYSGSCGGTSVGSGTSITVSPSATTTYYVRAVGNCNTTACASETVISVAPLPLRLLPLAAPPLFVRVAAPLCP